MNIRLLLFTLFIGIFVHPLSAQESNSFDPTQAYYLWPTEASHYLSSTFGETRAAHFHAALDIKTWGRKGYEVYATRDGIVDRVAIGPRGYGKVIYLKHNDDSYSIYAHLLSFNNELQQLADSVRFAENYQFEIEKFWGWRNIKVEQGDLIGYSGASGIGPPHLHFELRTPTNKPFNPLLTNLSVKDNIPPQIRGLSIEPLSFRSTIEGNNAIYTKRAKVSNGTYSFGTITINGPVGLGVNAFDQSNNVHNTYAVYELNLKVNGKQLFSSKVDSFSYNETHQMFIDRVYPLLKDTDKGFQRLFVADGNSLPFYNINGQNGALNLPSGTHNVTITAKDYYGNSSTAELTLKVSDTSPQQENRSFTNRNSTLRNISPEHWKWFSDWVTIPYNQYEYTTIDLANKNQLIEHANGISVNLTGQKYRFVHTPESGPLQLYRITPNSTSFISATDQNHFAVFPDQTFTDTVSVGMSVDSYNKDSLTVDIIPNAYPVNEEFSFYTARNSALIDTSKLSFYNFDQEDEDWELIPTRFTNSHIIGKAKTMGHFSLMRDLTAPKISNPYIRQHADDKWVIYIDAIDKLSGIDYSRSKIYVNNNQGIAEFEPENDRFVYYHPNFIPTPSMNVKVIAYDKMGNKAEQVFELKRKE
ncbi:MAG: peptidoglycan DD-metalloendopeptidase family protein [Aliifodinibius sp.]|nr:M23 family metallopeptidase [Fodinibius sp.]NIV13830.1 peptidoglycan DD-metalloendopeptidase family protein [Fodinibius sp.]NIY29078.1 peptidoglycan DD-metalloendopeptidase family protein [Fodinibius sp.]